MASLSRKWILYFAALVLSLLAACSDDDDNFLKQGEDPEELSSGTEEDSSSSSDKKQKDGSSSSVEKEGDSSSSEEPESSSSSQEPKFIPGTFVDERDGREYKTVTVNGYTWMAENLKYQTPNAVDTLNSLFYSDSEAVEACPRGWHLPNEDEWDDFFAGVENAYGEMGGYYLKSREGWEAYRDSVDGNGCDSLGFNVQPLGQFIVRSKETELRNTGINAYFWTSTLADRNSKSLRRLPYTVCFYTSGWTPGYTVFGNEILNPVRCLKNDNTMADSIGSCGDANVGEMFMFRDHYYACDTTGWERAFLKEILDFELGKCISSITGTVSMFRDTAYICRSKSMEWEEATVKEALGECEYGGKNNGEIKFYQGVPYYCDMWWSVATANQYLPQCDSTKTSDFETYRDTLYVCDRGSWKLPTETQVALGTCDKKRKGESVAVGDSQFVCIDHFWRPFSIVERELGVCTKDGAKGTYRGMEFVCDASRHLWKGTLQDSAKIYGVVAVDSLLWLTNNVTKTHWSVEISDSLNGVSYCPEGWIMPSKDEWTNMIAYVTRYGGLSAEFTIDSTAAIYGLNMVEEKEVDYWVPSQQYSCSGDEYSFTGRSCMATAAEVSNGSARMGSAWACGYVSSAGVCSSTSAIRCVLRP